MFIIILALQYCSYFDSTTVYTAQPPPRIQRDRRDTGQSYQDYRRHDNKRLFEPVFMGRILDSKRRDQGACFVGLKKYDPRHYQH